MARIAARAAAGARGARPGLPIGAFVAVEAVGAAVYFALPPSAAKVACYALLGLAPVAALLVGVARYRPRQPLAWHLLAAGQLLFTAGDLINNFDAWVRLTPTPTAIADPLYLAVYPVQAAGLVLLVRARTPGRDRASLIDAVIIATGVGLLSWVFLVVPYVRSPDLSLPQRLVAIAYPLGDVLLLAVAVRLWRTGGHSPASRLLTGGLLALLVGDTAYGLSQLTGGWMAGSPLDLIWVGYYLGLGSAALHPSMRSLSEPTTPRPTRLSWPRRLALTGATLMAPAMLVIQWRRGENLDVGVNAAGTAVLFVLLTSRLADMAGEAARQQERERALAGVVSATQQERRRLAADLHDGPVQQLTAVLLRLERQGVQLATGNVAAAQATLGQVQAALREQIGSLRGHLAELWPPALEQYGLEGALRMLADSVAERADVHVELEVQVDQRPNPTVEATVYQVVQEALTNVAKHAKAGNVWVRLVAGRDGVRLLVRDDGVGFDPAEATRLPDGEHFGLAGMRERVELIGGHWELSSLPDEGTVIGVALGPQVAAGR
ncbi:MAG TPA: sensor histidine kinase [Actinomycetota bacterium]